MRTVINTDYMQNLLKKDVVGKYIIHNGIEYGPITRISYSWNEDGIYITFYYEYEFKSKKNKIVMEEDSKTYSIYSDVILTDKKDSLADTLTKLIDTFETDVITLNDVAFKYTETSDINYTLLNPILNIKGLTKKDLKIIVSILFQNQY